MEQVTLVQQVLAVLAGVIVGFSPLPDRRGWLDPCRAAAALPGRLSEPARRHRHNGTGGGADGLHQLDPALACRQRALEAGHRLRHPWRISSCARRADRKNLSRQGVAVPVCFADDSRCHCDAAAQPVSREAGARGLGDGGLDRTGQLRRWPAFWLLRHRRRRASSCRG